MKDKKESLFVEPASNASNDLLGLFTDGLQDIYWAEKALIASLPKMIANASSAHLASALKEHLMTTQLQLERLDEVFALLGSKAEGKKCQAMAGLIKEGEEILMETAVGPVRDAGIIAASQKIEHYEIATYGTLHAFATTLGLNEAAMLLAKTLAEEKEADRLLNDVAFNAINFNADAASA
jgi:ferritin-like metal-binding protein YciE